MAQYQRFLSYLFEYEGNQKKQNCGFAKVEIRGDVQRIYLSVKNNETAEILHVFGFYREGEGCRCVPLGRMIVKNGKGQLQYINSGMYLAGSSVRFEQLCGLVAGRQQPFSNAYATVWDDKDFGLSLFDQNQKENETVIEKEIPQKQDILKEEISDEANDVQSLEVCSIEETNKEIPVEYISRHEGQSEASKIWEGLSLKYPHIETLPGDKMVCLKAMPADIGRLPKQNWMLSSNGFLMYSFVKHRYIVFARVMEDHYELWVPGNYEKSEELMAQMFGFYRFRSLKSQKAGNGDFGYWCVPLSFPTDN